MSTMAWQFEHSVDCEAAKAFAWSFWTNVSNWERLEGKAVDWIRISGPFASGTKGATKMPGQDPIQWRITQLVSSQSATIEMPLEGAIFFNRMNMESITPPHKT